MPVSLVVVTNIDGLPLFFCQLTELHFEVDPTLFSGFLAAMASFSQTVRRDFQLQDLGLGELRLFFDHGEKAITIIGILTQGITTEKIRGEILENYRRIVSLLGQSFHKSFNAQIDNWDGDPTTFKAFEQTLDLVLGVDGFSREKYLEELLGDFNAGRINQSDLVEFVWALIEDETDSTNGA
ncbi:MAG: hypothetical protein ACE5OZ_04940 [Candidatus Heimdallarchaeota archaeon]